MATLNTLRTKFGIVLSAVIALALLAFIFSLGIDMGFSSGNDPKVGEINGEAVSYSEYLEAYEDIRASSNISEVDQQSADQLAQATWDNLFNEIVLASGYESLGLAMGEGERVAVINGSIPTQSLYAFFADPATGQYNVAAVSQFLQQSATDPQASAAWDSLLEGVEGERSSSKYLSLVRAGAYATALEIEAGIATSTTSYAGRWVGKRYSSIEESDIEVSDKEISDFYNKNKEGRYKQDPISTAQYVEFAIAPTAQDEVAIEAEINSIAEDFKAAASPRIFAREHTRGAISNSYIASTQLRSEESAAIFADEFYGPVNNNDVWSVSKAVSVITAPDSVALRQIVLPYSQGALADSLVAALSAKGSAKVDFAMAAAQNSIFSQSAQNGGDLGVVPVSALPLDFVEPIAAARKGDVIKIESGEYIQILEVYQVGTPIKHAQIASIEYSVEASQATNDAIYNSASSFALMAKGGGNNFKSAADSLLVSVRPIELSSADRYIRGVEGSNQIATWVNNAKVGDVSQIFKAGEGYIVATLASYSSDKYRPLSQVSEAIRSEIMRDKKFAAISSQVASCSSLEQAADVLDSDIEEFSGVNFSAFYIPGMGVETRVIGAISAAPVAALSAPIQGNSGVYLFVVDEVDKYADQTPEAQRVLVESKMEDQLEQRSYSTLKSLANITDERGKYF